MDVTCRQIQTLCTGRRNDVGGISGKEKPAEAHRFGNKAAKRSNAFLDRRSDDQIIRCTWIKTALQLIPEAIVWPIVDMIIEGTL